MNKELKEALKRVFKGYEERAYSQEKPSTHGGIVPDEGFEDWEKDIILIKNEIEYLEEEVEMYKKGQAYEAKIADKALEKLDKIREAMKLTYNYGTKEKVYDIIKEVLNNEKNI